MAANNNGDKGTRNLVIAMVAFIVAVGVIFSLISNRANSNYAVPAAVSEADGYGIVLNPTSTPKIDVYLDYQCPACKAFELINGEYLNEVIAQKKAKVVFHPLTFIGPESIIAANAAACAADENKFVNMNLALYKNQASSENSGKWQGDAMLAVGDSIGLRSDSFKKCVADGKYVKWTGNVSVASGKANINSTPTIRIDGKDLDRNTEYSDQAKFKAALTAGGVK
jgi:protein-disulfide isomerase